MAFSLPSSYYQFDVGFKTGESTTVYISDTSPQAIVDFANVLFSTIYSQPNILSVSQSSWGETLVSSFSYPNIEVSANSLHLPDEGTVSYTVVLSSQPLIDFSVNVTIGPNSYGANLLTESPETTLAFSPDNWDTPQTVTITAGPIGQGAVDIFIENNYAGLTNGPVVEVKGA
jgi:hypothetical protein